PMQRHSAWLGLDSSSIDILLEPRNQFCHRLFIGTFGASRGQEAPAQFADCRFPRLRIVGNVVGGHHIEGTPACLDLTIVAAGAVLLDYTPRTLLLRASLRSNARNTGKHPTSNQ